jgi:hypothetical protein
MMMINKNKNVGMMNLNVNPHNGKSNNTISISRVNNKMIEMSFPGKKFDSIIIKDKITAQANQNGFCLPQILLYFICKNLKGDDNLMLSNDNKKLTC